MRYLITYKIVRSQLGSSSSARTPNQTGHNASSIPQIPCHVRRLNGDDVLQLFENTTTAGFRFLEGLFNWTWDLTLQAKEKLSPGAKIGLAALAVWIWRAYRT